MFNHVDTSKACIDNVYPESMGVLIFKSSLNGGSVNEGDFTKGYDASKFKGASSLNTEVDLMCASEDCSISDNIHIEF